MIFLSLLLAQFYPDPRPPAFPDFIKVDTVKVDTIPWHWDVLGRKVEEK
jgi:hypothetical protein